MRISIRSVVALSTCLLLGWSASALGATGDDVVKVTTTVKFNDLNISKAEGALSLYERIEVAARTVCRGATPYQRARACQERAVDDAVQGVGSALLSSIHRSAVERVEEVVLR